MWAVSVQPRDENEVEECFLSWFPSAETARVQSNYAPQMHDGGATLLFNAGKRS